ncbi:MAG TPA: YetF domain-containing protein [Burkholderiaceae bacterium]
MDFKDLVDVFGMTMPVLELVLRGSVMYWFLVLVFRLILRRDVGSMGITDFLFIVLLGDAAQNGMIGEASSATDAIALIATLVFWNVLIDWATWRFKWVERLFAAQRLCLVRDGRLNRRNMRREFISDAELMSKVREEGLEQLSDVKAMYLESDGEISLIRRQGPDDKPPPPPVALH